MVFIDYIHLMSIQSSNPSGPPHKEIPLKALGKYMVGSACLDAVTTFFQGSKCKLFPTALLETDTYLFIFQGALIFAFFLASHLCNGVKLQIQFRQMDVYHTFA